MNRLLNLLLIVVIIQNCQIATISNGLQYSDEIPPKITILKPVNNSIKELTVWFCALDAFELEFAINEEISWIGYSLNQRENITITGNTTVDTTVGSQRIIVFANDTSGNMGRSDTVYLSIIQVIPSSSTTNSLGINSTGGFISGIIFLSLIVQVKKRRKRAV